jgi:hypothetical protein
LAANEHTRAPLAGRVEVPFSSDKSRGIPRRERRQITIDLRGRAGFAAAMRTLFALCLTGLLAALVSGCATSSAKFSEVPGVSEAAPESTSPPTSKATRPARAAGKTQPDDTLVGRVVSANARGRFAILNFPLTRMPAVDTRMFVYRNGQIVGEVRISGPQKDDNIVADVFAGEAAPGDEVRER